MAKTIEKFRDNLKDKLWDFKNNLNNKFRNEQEEVKKYNAEIDKLNTEKAREESRIISHADSSVLNIEISAETNSKVFELENQNQKLELNLQDLSKKNETYNQISKARIDEFLLYKRMLWEWLDKKEIFNEMLKWTKINELASAINLKELDKYYKDNFWNRAIKNNEQLSSESKKLRDNIWTKTLQELETIWMWTSEDMVNTISTNKLEIAKVQNQINANNITIKNLTWKTNSVTA